MVRHCLEVTDCYLLNRTIWAWSSRRRVQPVALRTAATRGIIL
jgi:hypothetical protein